MKTRYLASSAVLLVSAIFPPAWGQAGHDMAQHGGSEAAKPAAAAGAAMDHGDMRMQGGDPPPDARDPDAYSGGYTLDKGNPAVNPSRQLRLADEHSFGSLLVEKLERVHSSSENSTNYDVQAWFGGTYNRAVLKAEGEISRGKLEDSRTELLWSRALSTFWDTQIGLRQDGGAGPGRTWMALGIQGLAPYWFEVEATAYVGPKGRTALRLGGSYDLLLTQKLILQPRAEATLYGKSDQSRGLGSGLATLSAGVRLRYEFSRQFAPYVGVEWGGRFGQTANLAQEEGSRKNDTRIVAGVRLWF